MKAGIKGFVGVVLMVGILATAQWALAERGGWEDPAGGWDIVFEGDYPDVAAMGADGWYQGTGSGEPGFDNNYATWGDWDLADTVFMSLPGLGEIERGVTTSTALVFQVRDDETVGAGGDGQVRRWKAGKPFAGDYTVKADDLLHRNGGVTIVARLRVIRQDPDFPFLEPDAGNRTYRTDVAFGFDGADGPSGTAGLAVGPDAARWTRDDQTPSSHIETGDLTTFHTFWAVFEPQSQGNVDNYAARLWMDGSLTPKAPKWEGPGHTGNDGISGTADGNESLTFNWYDQSDRFDQAIHAALTGKAMAQFGPSRTGAQITVQYDYICWKTGAHLPTLAGPPAAPSNLTATLPVNRIVLDWADNSNNEDGFAVERATSGTTLVWTEIGRTGPDEIQFRDPDAPVPGTTYVYRVRGFNGALLGNYSNEASFAVPAGSLGVRRWELYVK